MARTNPRFAARIDSALRSRKRIDLYAWVEARRASGDGWRQVAADLSELIGWDDRPVSHEWLRRWWNERTKGAA